MVVPLTGTGQEPKLHAPARLAAELGPERVQLATPSEQVGGAVAR